MPIDLALTTLARGLVEVAGFSLIGQGLLALLAGERRQQNIFYRILATIARPALRTVRLIAPRIIVDAHVPLLTFFLLFWLWVALGIAKHHLCGLHGLAC